jgi:2-polyprenyl-6-methoxyphenol hydroxylase-like FAD-dependent oxidoreductase
MAGVLLEDVELPREGYGHLFLGGPGPVFVLRIGARHVRMCLDVPAGRHREMTAPASLWNAYQGQLPDSLRPAFRRALQENRVSWTANHWRRRTHYGRPGVVMVGDAVGHFHPLTAVGMTLGFLDAWQLARSRNLTEYRQQRSIQSCVPGLLAVALHRVFTGRDDGSTALRQAVYRLWRENKSEGRLTMKLLSGEETGLPHFNRAFLKVMLLALQDVVQTTVRTGEWQQSARTFRDFGGWLGWLAAGPGLGIL